MAKPHVIYILAEQLRYDVLNAYGDRQCDTPNLDELASQSSIFGRHFTPCPLCVPARSSIMTGLTPRQHGAIINGWYRSEREYGTVKPDTPLLPNHLVDAGYRVIHAGIQHVRSQPEFRTACDGAEFVGPTSVGSHHRRLISRGLMLPDMSVFRDPTLEYENGKMSLSAGTSPRTALFPLRENLFYDMTLASNIVEVLEEHDETQPLALFANFWLPHPPLWAPRNWALKVAPESVQLPSSVGRWFSGMPAMQLANVPGQLGAHVSMEQWQHSWALYLGMVSLLDHCVGRLLESLKGKGMYDDAVVIFTADHGDMLGSHRMYQKMCLYDEVVRVPLLVKTPGQQKARHVTELTDHLDLTAAVCDFAEAEPMPDSPGISLRASAEGVTNTEPRQYVFAAYDGSAGRGFFHRMVRTPTHKFIHNIGDRSELYDLIDDPRETHNLSGKPEYRELEIELQTQLNQWMDEQGDDQPRCEVSEFSIEDDEENGDNANEDSLSGA